VIINCHHTVYRITDYTISATIGVFTEINICSRFAGTVKAHARPRSAALLAPFCWILPMKLPVDKLNFNAYIIGMLLPGINLVPVIERVVNDFASVIGIAALLLALIKKIKILPRQEYQPLKKIKLPRGKFEFSGNTP
jgi:hypothetical protein